MLKLCRSYLPLLHGFLNFGAFNAKALQKRVEMLVALEFISVSWLREEMR